MTDHYYDSISSGYDGLYGQEQLQKAGIIAKLIRPKKTELLLDVGCGSGIYLEMFGCQIIGIDPSLELLRQAAEQQEGQFIQAVAENLPFKDKSFDYILSLTAVHNFQDVKKGLQEIKRVSKGTIVLSILRQARKFPEIEKTIGELFTAKRIILEEKDIIFVLDCAGQKDLNIHKTPKRAIR